VWQRSHQSSSLSRRHQHHVKNHVSLEGKTRVSAQGSFNSNSSSSTATSSSFGLHHQHHLNHNNHSLDHHHHVSSSIHLNPNDFCTTISSASSSPVTGSATLTRSSHHHHEVTGGTGSKKVSFVSPSDSLILYDNKMQSDTQVWLLVMYCNAFYGMILMVVLKNVIKSQWILLIYYVVLLNWFIIIYIKEYF